MKKTITAILAAAMVCGVSAFAESGITTSIDKVTGEYVVSGTIGEAADTGYVSVLVTAKEDGSIAHAGDDITDRNGMFSYGFNMSDDILSGEYNVFIGTHNLAIPYTNSFYHVSSAKKAELLEFVNAAATDAEMLRNSIKTEIRDYQITLSESVTLSDEELLKICERTVARRPFIQMTDFNSTFYNEMALVAAKTANLSEMTALLKEYEAIYSLKDCTLYEFYKKYVGEDSSFVNEFLINKDYETAADIQKECDKAVFLREIKKTTNYSTANAFFESYKGIVTFSTDKWNSLSPLARGGAVYGKTFNTMSELEAAINGASESAKPNGGGGFAGGGGSGGSGGGGFLNVAKPENTVKPTEPTVPVKQENYSDVPAEFWAEEYITALSDMGIVAGYGDGSFKPDKSVKREEFVKLLVMALGIETEGKESAFDDIPENHWAYAYVSAAVDAGIVTGASDTLFGAGRNITREEMAVTVSRALKISGDGEPFSDDESISDWARTGVYAVRSYGIITGFEDGSFRPSQGATRAQATAIIYRAMEAGNEK